MRLWLRLSVFLLATSSGWAGFQQELVPGLPYYRIADYTKDAADVQTALTKDSVVIDLRSAIGSVEAAASLTKGLEQARTSERGIRLILINPSTSAEIIDAVSRPRPRQLTIGPRAPTLTPDIAVSSSAEEDRRAYDALTSGTPLEKLISSSTEKKRFDEAALVRTRAGGAAAAAQPAADTDAADTSAPGAGAEKASPTPAPNPPGPHDLVLERAVQIFRALSINKR